MLDKKNSDNLAVIETNIQKLWIIMLLQGQSYFLLGLSLEFKNVKCIIQRIFVHMSKGNRNID